MLHFARETGGGDPLADDQGQSGAAAFDDVFFDGTSGGPGEKKDQVLFVFNDDDHYQYHSPVISISGTDPVALNTWFRLIDAKNVAGSTPTETEWAASGVAGDLNMTMDDVTRSGGLTPERKMWVRCWVPGTVAPQVLTGLKIRVSAVAEAA